MGIKALNWAWDIKNLKSGQKLVLLALADWADDYGFCWPSIEKIAEKCCMGRTGVISNIKKLIELGIVAIETRRVDSNGYRRSNVYLLNLSPSTDSELRKENSLSPDSERSDSDSLSPDSEPAIGRNPNGNIIDPQLEPSIDPSINKIRQKKKSQVVIVEEIFSHWQTTMQHPEAKLDAKRKRRIKNALTWKYTPSQLCEAITGCSLTPHNMGHNDRGEIYDDIGLILRDASQIERFIRNAQNPPKNKNGGSYANGSTGNRENSFNGGKPLSASASYERTMRAIRGAPEQQGIIIDSK